MCRGRCRGRCKNIGGMRCLCFEKGISKTEPFSSRNASRPIFYNVPYTVPYMYPTRPLHVPYVPYKHHTFSCISVDYGHRSIRKAAATAPPRFPAHTRVCHPLQAATPGIRWPMAKGRHTRTHTQTERKWHRQRRVVLSFVLCTHALRHESGGGLFDSCRQTTNKSPIQCTCIFP